jgi:preprotein translocase subunit SecF
MKFSEWYDKNYRKTLIIPFFLIAFALIFMIYFSVSSDGLFYKDVSLTGGTSYTVMTNYSSSQLDSDLSQYFTDYTVKAVSDGSGDQIQIIVTVPEENSESMQQKLEEILEFELNDDNTSIEFTSSSLSGTFLKQLYISIILSFFLMGLVVFLIFGNGGKLKFWIIVANIVFTIFLGNYFLEWNAIVSWAVFFVFAIGLFYTYIKNSVPAFAVMLSAFADIIMTLSVVNIIGMKLSTAGIVSFLMLIGYSVDTDIMLTSRLLERKESVNQTIYGAFKTGFSMTITSIIAVAIALFVVYPYASVLNQIFTILLIGLVFDLMNTWITNASILKWFFHGKERNKK